jgi:hypothetical protein
MGSENTIRTGTTNGNNRNGSFSNSNSISSTSPSSIYQFGIVTAINPTTKEIIYNAIEDNVASRKLGKALPLYKNKIQLPTTGSVVPLLRGPNTDISAIGGQYSKTVYYMDPIGIWQTVEENIIERTSNMFPQSAENRVDKLDIKNAEIGIPSNNPLLEQKTVDAAQRPLPSPSAVVIPTSITPLPSPDTIPAPTPGYTFTITLVKDEWMSQTYYNNILIDTTYWWYKNFDEKTIRAHLTLEAKHFGFVKNNQAYPPQPNLV